MQEENKRMQEEMKLREIQERREMIKQKHFEKLDKSRLTTINLVSKYKGRF
jgi:hypothetical protein